MLADVLPYLACPHCGADLTLAGRVVRCASGHGFDIARQGYVSLLSGRAPVSGDSADMVAARADFLAAGHYAPIARAIVTAAGLSGAATKDATGGAVASGAARATRGTSVGVAGTAGDASGVADTVGGGLVGAAADSAAGAAAGADSGIGSGPAPGGSGRVVGEQAGGGSGAVASVAAGGTARAVGDEVTGAVSGAAAGEPGLGDAAGGTSGTAGDAAGIAGDDAASPAAMGDTAVAANDGAGRDTSGAADVTATAAAGPGAAAGDTAGAVAGPGAAAGDTAGAATAAAGPGVAAGDTAGAVGTAGPGAGGATGCVADLGAGTGYYLAAVLDANPQQTGLALEISKPALRRAARAHPRLGAVGCDAWGRLPVRSGSISLALNVFAPRNPAELYRILAPDGVLVVVSPTTDHLAGLVAGLGLLTVAPDKVRRVAEQLAPLEPSTQDTCEFELTLSHADVLSLVGMGPSAWHIGREALGERVAALPEPVRTTASVVVTAFRRA